MSYVFKQFLRDITNQEAAVLGGAVRIFGIF